MSCSSLPEDLWKKILHFVPYSERLGSCSSVSWTLYRAAAAAATQEVMLSGGSTQRFMGLQQWMLHHGHHITSVQLSASNATLTELPCPNLRSLKLVFTTVQLGASSTQLGVLHRCTRLTKLQVNSCLYTDGQNGLAALSALVCLQHLELHISYNNGAHCQMPSTVFQHLQQLTYIDVLDRQPQFLNTRTLEHISCLVNLQELRIESKVSLSPSTIPGISRLTALHTLSLQDVELDPVCLQDCTQVQSLQLCYLQYDPHVAAAAYSSLTASSKLQKLRVTVVDLPPGIWRHVFPQDRKLPALQEFVVDFNDWDVSLPPPSAVLGTDDISCLVSCCPGLRDVEIDAQPGLGLAGFAKAAALTSLKVGFMQEVDFEPTGSALSKLVSLEQLSIWLVGPITPSDLLCLTALTTLTRLSIDALNAPGFGLADGVDLCLTLVSAMPRRFGVCISLHGVPCSKPWHKWLANWTAAQQLHTHDT